MLDALKVAKLALGLGGLAKLKVQDLNAQHIVDIGKVFEKDLNHDDVRDVLGLIKNDGTVTPSTQVSTYLLEKMEDPAIQKLIKDRIGPEPLEGKIVRCIACANPFTGGKPTIIAQSTRTMRCPHCGNVSNY